MSDRRDPRARRSAGMPPERCLGRLLVERGWTIAVAESCTGGGLGARLTSVAGSSAWFRGGIIAYADGVKRALLGVPAAMLARFGAVSAPVAKRMALAAQARLNAEVGIGTTGIAGPGGGTARKPVGLVFVGLAVGRKCIIRRIEFRGTRAAVRRQAAQAALRMAVSALGK